MSKQYTVEPVLLPETKKRPEQKCYFILKNDYPDDRINGYFKKQINQLISTKGSISRIPTTPQYIFSDLANYLYDNYGKDYVDIEMKELNSYLEEKHSNGVDNKSICNYIDIIHNIYNYLYLTGYDLHPSLFKKNTAMVLNGAKGNNGDLLINNLKQLYKSKRFDYSMPGYKKWYTPDEIKLIANELRIDYKCIFLITCFTGYRIDSAISIKLSDFKATANTVRESRSKTGQLHTAPIPPFLTKLIVSYILNFRNIYINSENTSDSLFIGKNGNETSYHNYISALSDACNRLGFTESLHSHAGRSTFLSMMRTYQLEKRRKNEEVFNDYDLCLLMDWKNLSNLENYDLLNRINEVAPFIDDFFKMAFSENDI